MLDDQRYFHHGAHAIPAHEFFFRKLALRFEVRANDRIAGTMHLFCGRASEGSVRGIRVSISASGTWREREATV
jgi:hypothetical protein